MSILFKHGGAEHIQDEDNKDIFVIHNTYLDKKVKVIDGKVQGYLPEGNYVFYIQDFDGEVWLSISDYAYFKKKGYTSDWHLSFLALPEFLDEEAEGSFSSSQDIETTRQFLLSLGYIEDPSYSSLIQSHL